MRYPTVIFDVDGTLTDSAQATADSFAEVLVEFGYDAPSAEAREMAIRASSEEALRFAGVTDISPVLNRWNIVLPTYFVEDLIFDGIPQLLEALKAAGCRMGVVTSRSHEEVDLDPLMKRFMPYFDACVCVEDVEHPKPAADPMLLCMKLLGGKPEDTVYIGDSPTDGKSAAAAGIDFALASWGAREPIAAKYTPEKPSDLLPILLGESITTGKANSMVKAL